MSLIKQHLHQLQDEMDQPDPNEYDESQLELLNAIADENEKLMQELMSPRPGA